MQQQADIDKEIAHMAAQMEELAKKSARINAHISSKEVQNAQGEAEIAAVQMSTQDLQLAFNAFGAIYQVFGMITVAGSLIAGFALTPIAEMDMSAAPEVCRDGCGRDALTHPAKLCVCCLVIGAEADDPDRLPSSHSRSVLHSLHCLRHHRPGHQGRL